MTARPRGWARDPGPDSYQMPCGHYAPQGAYGGCASCNVAPLEHVTVLHKALADLVEELDVGGGKLTTRQALALVKARQALEKVG